MSAVATTTVAGQRTVPEVWPAPRADYWAGVRAMAPLMVAYVPFGLLVGAAAAASANPTAAWLATWAIYGGAAHLAVLDVLAQGRDHSGQQGRRDFYLGAAATLFGLGPLLGAARVPTRVSRAAGWAGVSVLAALVARSVAGHQDPDVPAAPLVAAVSLAVALGLAHRGRSALLSVTTGALVYLATTAVLSTV